MSLLPLWVREEKLLLDQFSESKPSSAKKDFISRSTKLIKALLNNHFEKPLTIIANNLQIYKGK